MFISWLTMLCAPAWWSLAGRSSDELDGQIAEMRTDNRWKTHTLHTHTPRVHMCYPSYLYSILVCGVRMLRICMHTCQDSRFARAHVLMCVFKQAYLFTFASKTHSHLNAGDRTHLPALWTARQFSQNILEYTHILHHRTHTHSRLPGVPHMQRLGSAKLNFLKAKSTSLEQSSLA